MVESIYGGKTFPSSNESFLHPGASCQRRTSWVEGFSTSPLGLHTISETDDDLRGSASALDEYSSSDTPRTSGRQVRALSLPAIYRDGSYLRMNFPPKFLQQEKKRRFSEPAVSLIAKESNLPLLNGFQKNNIQRVNPLEDLSKASTKSTAKMRPNLASNRRHSDPMFYAREQQKFLLSSGAEDSRNKVNTEICLLPVAGGENAEGEIGKTKLKPEPHPKRSIQTNGCARRRKSSLVPIPFSVAQGQKKKTLSKRPLSFPPSKIEESSRKNFRDFRLDIKQEARDLLQNHPGVFPDEEFVQIDENDLGSLPNNEGSKYACENIITQWMKFFG